MELKNTRKYNHYLYDLILYLKISPKSFSEKLGLERADRIYNVLNGKNELSKDLARLIITKFPEVSFNWLVTGGDPMLEINNNTEKKDVPFKERPIDEKLNIIYNQNLDIIKDNQDLKDLSIKLCETIKDVFYMLNTQIEDIFESLEITLSDDKKELISKIKERNQLEHN